MILFEKKEMLGIIIRYTEMLRRQLEISILDSKYTS
jgi:hypothetical protein